MAASQAHYTLYTYPLAYNPMKANLVRRRSSKVMELCVPACGACVH